MNQAKIQAGRVALVTGAARRIGAAIVEKLHAAGFNVVIHCHTSRIEADALAKQLNTSRADSAYVCVANLIEKQALLALVKKAEAWQGRLDVLVNNASRFIRTDLGLFDEQAWDTLWLTNVKAPFCLSEAAQPFLADVGGCIVNITDIHAEKPLQDYAVYAQTKAALKMQTEALARAYAPGVRVNAVAPGAILWPEGDNALSEAIQHKICSSTPLQCHGAPRWIADAVLSLIQNLFMTGQTLRVDGGRSLV